MSNIQKDTAEIIAGHYQHTVELTTESWKERNRLFVFLIVATGIGLLLVLKVPEARSLLVDFIVKLLEITKEERIEQLQENFPLDVILSMILIIVFYLMQKLYSTNLSVFRHYIYLGALEKEIRKSLSLPDDSISFTREGEFYWGKRSFTQKISKWYYILVILIILLPFITLKIIDDFNTQTYLLAVVDIVVSVGTFLYFVEYVRSATKFDVKEISETPEETEDSNK